MNYSRTKPISQIDVENEILRLKDILEDETEVFERLAEDAAEKEARYKGAWAKEYLGGGEKRGTVKEREAWADYKLTDSYEDFKIAEALVKAKREKLSSLRTSIDALRTLAANVRHQVT